MAFDHSTRILVGSIYLGLAIVALPIHLVILKLFVTYENYRNSPAYRILFSIGLADCLQLFAHIYTGLITIIKDNINYNLEKYMGALANAAWLALIPQILVLSLNRFEVFKNLRKDQNIWLTIFLLVLCWIFGGIYFVLYMTDLTGIIYDNENFYWGYDSGEWSEVVSSVEYYTSILILSLTFIVYLAIAVIIILMKSSLTSDKQPLVKKELLLLIQSFIIFLYAVVLICCWHFYTYFLPDSPWTPIIIDIFWILFGALNPVLYLSMNRTIRRRFLRTVLTCGSQKYSLDIFMTPSHHARTGSRIPHTLTFP